MRKCWAHCPEVRPSFRVLKEQLINVSQGLLNDWLSLLRCLRFSSPTERPMQVIEAPRSPFLERFLSSSAPSSNASSYNSSTLPMPKKHRHRTDLLQLSSTLKHHKSKNNHRKNSDGVVVLGSNGTSANRHRHHRQPSVRHHKSRARREQENDDLFDDANDEDEDHHHRLLQRHHHSFHHHYSTKHKRISSVSPVLRHSDEEDDDDDEDLKFPLLSVNDAQPGVCDVCSSYGHPWIEICKAIRATRGN